MSSDDRNRVLNRRGAHELTQEEMEKIISGGDLHTLFTSFMTAPISNPDHQFDQ